MISKFKNKLQNKDVKVLAENFISLSALQIIGLLLPLITLPYLLRTIGFEKYGTIVFSAALITYFQSLTDYSFRVTAVRDVAIFKNNQIKLNIIYSKVLTIKLLFLIISIILIMTIVMSYKPFLDEKLVYSLSILMLLGYALFPEWFFQGIEKMKYITYLNLGIKLFFTFCVFIFIRSESDYWKYPLLQGLGFIGAGIVGQIILVRNYKLKFIFLSKKIIYNTIKANFPLFINQFVPTLYNNTSTFLLGLIGTKSMVGVYQAILTIVNLGVTLIEIFSRVFFPFLNRKSEAFEKYKKMMLIVVASLSLGLLIFYKLIFWYLNITSSSALPVFFVLVLGLLGYTLSNIFGLNYFIIKRQDKLVMKNTIFSSIIGFILSFPLIYSLGMLGAAINLSLSRWIMGGGLYYKYLKENKRKKSE